MAPPEAELLSLSTKQRAFFWNDKRFLVYLGGRNGGKTTAAVARLLGMVDRGEILDNARIVVFGPTYPQLKKGTIQTFDKWFDAAGYTVEKINGNEPERRLIRGITVYFRNASNPDQTRSHEVQVVWLDEAAQMDEGVLTLTNAALRQFGDHALYQTLITSTPRGRNWLYRWFYDPATYRYDTELFDTYTTTTIEAEEEGIVRQGYLSELGYVPGSDMYKQEVEAQFLTWSGLVFDRFNPTIHCPEPFILPKLKTVTGGVDVGYGGRGFTSIHLTGITEAGALYTFKEYHEKRAQTHEWMRVCGEWTKEHRVTSWHIDAAADQELKAMKSAGLRARPSMKAKDAAGVAVGFLNSKFQRHELFIDRTACPFLVSEIEAYRYKEIMDGDETTFIMKVVPNQHDDAIDSWRYGAYPLASSVATQSYGQTLDFAFGR